MARLIAIAAAAQQGSTTMHVEWNFAMAMSEQEWVAVAAVAVDSSGIQWRQCQGEQHQCQQLSFVSAVLLFVASGSAAVVVQTLSIWVQAGAWRFGVLATPVCSGDLVCSRQQAKYSLDQSTNNE